VNYAAIFLKGDIINCHLQALQKVKEGKTAYAKSRRKALYCRAAVQVARKIGTLCFVSPNFIKY